MNERIKQLRKKLALTQTEFGSKIGLTTSAISDIERGRVKIVTESNIKLICNTLNVSEVWLRTGEGEMFNPENDDLDFLIGQLGESKDEFRKKLIKNLCKLSDPQWESLKELLKDLMA